MATGRGGRIRGLALLAALGLVLVACGGGTPTRTTGTPSPTGSPLEVKQARVILDWIWDVGFGALAYGLEKGYFKEQGIELNVIPGRGSDLAMQQINQGKVEFAFTDLSTFLIQRVKGQTNTTAVYAWANSPGTGILSLKPINEPEDMAGKTFGTVAFSSGKDSIPFVLEQNGVDASKVKVELLDFGVLYPSLFERRIDTAEAVFGGSYEGALVAARNAGIELHFKLLSDWGFRDYTKLLIVRNDVIQKDPDLVTRTIAAFHKSITDALATATGEDLYQALTKVTDQVDQEQTVLGWKNLKTIVSDPGPIDPAVVQYILDFLAATQDLRTDVSVSDFYDNSFIPTG